MQERKSKWNTIVELQRIINGLDIVLQQLLLKKIACYSQGVKENMYWIPIKELDKYKAFPTFMKEYLQSQHNGIEHIVTDERK